MRVWQGLPLTSPEEQQTVIGQVEFSALGGFVDTTSHWDQRSGDDEQWQGALVTSGKEGWAADGRNDGA